MCCAEVHYPLHLSFLIHLLNDSTLHITSDFDSQLKTSKSIHQTHRTQSITKMRPAGKAVTSKDKCYRMHRNQRFALKLFSLVSILMVIRSGGKNLLHQSFKLNTFVSASCLLLPCGWPRGSLAYVPNPTDYPLLFPQTLVFPICLGDNLCSEYFLE